MDVFSFDEVFFFHRLPHDECWYVSLNPSLCIADTDSFADGYFRVDDGTFERASPAGRAFNQEEICRVQTILSEHAQDMQLEQFEIHTHLPRHYSELNNRTNRYSDLWSRSRQTGTYDPNFGVAFEQLTKEYPSYRLTREFVKRVLQRASEVSNEERDRWLHEQLLENWMNSDWYDSDSEQTFESYYQRAVRGLLFPKPGVMQENTKYRIYEIEHLPNVFLFAEETYLPEYELPSKSSCHFLDRGSALVPIPLPNHNGMDYYLS